MVPAIQLCLPVQLLLPHGECRARGVLGGRGTGGAYRYSYCYLMVSPGPEGWWWTGDRRAYPYSYYYPHGECWSGGGGHLYSY